MNVMDKIGTLSPEQHQLLMARLRERRKDARAARSVPQIAPDPARLMQPFALTEIQEAYWVGRQGSFSMGNVSAHGYLEIDVIGLDLTRLENAFNHLIARHPMLRAVIDHDGRQRILPRVPHYRFAINDLHGVDTDLSDQKLHELRAELSHQVLPADVWPLFDIRASKMPGGKLRLHLSLDVLILDAHSFDLISAEWQHYYHHPDSPLPPLAFSFADYVHALAQLESTPDFAESLRYWRERLDNLPGGPEFPLACNPDSIAAPHFSHRSMRLPLADWNRVKQRAGSLRITPAALLLAVYACVVGRWSQSPRFSLNLTLFNRLPFHPEVAQLVGDFTTVTLLAIDLSQPQTFSNLALAIQRQLWQDLDHRSVSGVRVLRELTERRRGSGSVLMPVVFTGAINSQGESASAPLAWAGPTVYSVTQTPQVWLDCQATEQDGTLVIDWDSVDELFQPGFVDAMFDGFSRLLQGLAEEGGNLWDQSRLNLVPDNQRELMRAANRTQAPVPAGLLQDAVLDQCRIRPDSLAVADAAGSLSFGQLYQRSNALAHALVAQGVPVGALVAVALPKSAGQVVAVLGILEAGAAYLPLEPGLPQERLDDLLRLSGAAALVMDEALRQNRNLPQGLPLIDIDALQTGPVHPLPPLRSQTDLAYVIYTSGSTGTPKGVAIDHRGALNTCVDVNQRFEVGPQDRVLGLSALNFDLSVWDIFGVLGAGGALILPEPARAREPAHWAALMATHGVTIWNTVPALLDLYVSYLRDVAGEPDKRLRIAMMSGDWIALSLPGQIRAWCPDARIYSLGGATEASIWSIVYPIEQVDPAWRSIPYGLPMLNQTFTVRDANLDLVPVGVPGELMIGGIGVAMGYWRDTERTAQQFVRCPHSGERLYRTGDLGRWMSDGTLEILGRMDFQVKINGYRVELGEIEAAMGAYDGVQTAVAHVVQMAGNKGGTLVGYYLADGDGSDKQLEKLRSRMARTAIRRFDQTGIALPALPPLSAARRSTRHFTDAVVSMATLTSVLTPLRQLDDGGLVRYRYGSGGSLYPVQLYVHVSPDRVEGLAAGMYYYHPAQHALHLITADLALPAELYPKVNQPIAAAAAVRLFLVASRQAVEPSYGKSSPILCLLEAGAMAQLLEDAAASAGLGMVHLGGFNHDRAGDPFRMGEDALYLQMLAAGMPAPEPQAPVMTRAQWEQGMREYLAQRLPDYMVPKHFVCLDKMPLSANGKVDRKALPMPQTAAPRRAPLAGRQRDSAESRLSASITALWAEVLGLPQVQADDNFFDLGGTSVDMIRIHTRLQPQLPLEMTLVDMFFSYPSISDLVSHVLANAPQAGMAAGGEGAAAVGAAAVGAAAVGGAAVGTAAGGAGVAGTAAGAGVAASGADPADGGSQGGESGPGSSRNRRRGRRTTGPD